MNNLIKFSKEIILSVKYKIKRSIFNKNSTRENVHESCKRDMFHTDNALAVLYMALILSNLIIVYSCYNYSNTFNIISK